MVLYESHLLFSYDKQIAPYLSYNCKCYDEIKKNLVENIINCRKSYMGCLMHKTGQRIRTNHKSVPIMIGSFIDYLIRGKEEVEKSRTIWCTFIIRGVLKIYPAFSTFDSLSLHLRDVHGKKRIEWFTYIGNNGLALVYENGTVKWTYNRKTETNSKWIQLLNEADPFNKTPVDMKHYINLFEVMLKHPYDMNDLKNRQILNGVTIMRKFIENDIAKRSKTNSSSGATKLSELFENGNFYTVLCKKNTYETMDWCKNYPQTYDNALHEGRSNKASHFINSVSRATNDAFRNSKWLQFPDDAKQYFCMLNTKDLKTVGEQHTLTDFTIMTETSDQRKVYNFLMNKRFEGDGTGNYIFHLNGFRIASRRTWNFDNFVFMKRNVPHVTVLYYDNYILFSTKDSIPIKYCDKYNIYFSVFESTYYNHKFPPFSTISLTAKELGVIAINRNLPQKSTVSINNIRGCVANIECELQKTLVKTTQGITSYMFMNDEIQQTIFESATLARNQDTSTFHYWYDIAKKEHLIPTIENDEEMKKNSVDTDAKAAVFSLFDLYDINELLREPSDKEKIESYVKTVLNSKYYKPPTVWNLQLYVAFGDLQGKCNEDGIVLDKKAIKHIPPIHYNACITVDFMFKTIKQPASAIFVPVEKLTHDTKLVQNILKERNSSNNKTHATKANRIDDMKNETLIGCLITEYETTPKNSQHFEVITARIGNHFYYLLFFLPIRNNVYEDLNVRCIKDSKIITIVLQGTRKSEINVGAKLANAFGQKNVCAGVDDLSSYCGVTRDGRLIHAQCLYSRISIIGRLTAAQINYMLSSTDLAFGKNGEMIAPINIVIHSLHPYTNIKIFDIKVDTLTNINGFDSQALSNTSHELRQGSVLYDTFQVINMHGFNLSFEKVSNTMSVLYKNEKNSNIIDMNKNVKENDEDGEESSLFSSPILLPSSPPYSPSSPFENINRKRFLDETECCNNQNCKIIKLDNNYINVNKNEQVSENDDEDDDDYDKEIFDDDNNNVYYYNQDEEAEEDEEEYETDEVEDFN